MRSVLARARRCAVTQFASPARAPRGESAGELLAHARDQRGEMRRRRAAAAAEHARAARGPARRELAELLRRARPRCAGSRARPRARRGSGRSRTAAPARRARPDTRPRSTAAGSSRAPHTHLRRRRRAARRRAARPRAGARRPSTRTRRARARPTSRAARSAAVASRRVFIVSTRIASTPARARWRACSACSRASACRVGDPLGVIAVLERGARSEHPGARRPRRAARARPRAA